MHCISRKQTVNEGLVLAIVKHLKCCLVLQVAWRQFRTCRNVVFTSVDASRNPPTLWEEALRETTIHVIPPEEVVSFVDKLCNLH